MNQNFFDYNILQQKNNLEYQLFEANKLIEELEKTLTLILEASGGTPPPPPRPNRQTPTRKPPVRPGTVPEGESAPTRPTNPGGDNTQPPVWRPRWPGHEQPPANPLETPPGWYLPGIGGDAPRQPGWYRRPPNPDGVWDPGGGRRYFSPMGPRPTPLPKDGKYWLLGNDGRVWVWDPSRNTWDLGGRLGQQDSPWGTVNPSNPYVTPPSDKPGHRPLPGGGWGTPTVTPNEPSTPKPENKPLGPTRFDDERPTRGPDDTGPSRGPVPSMFEPSQPNPWWRQFGDSVEYKNNNYLMEAAMRMMYKKPSFH